MQFDARARQAALGRGNAGGVNPVLSASWVFFAALLGMGGVFFLLTGGPFLLGLGLIIFSCTVLSPKERRRCR